MHAGHRDQVALTAAASLTEAAAKMRAARENTIEKVELDASAVSELRKDFAEAMTLLALEVQRIKEVVLAIGDAAEIESRGK